MHDVQIYISYQRIKLMWCYPGYCGILMGYLSKLSYQVTEFSSNQSKLTLTHFINTLEEVAATAVCACSRKRIRTRG